MFIELTVKRDARTRENKQLFNLNLIHISQDDKSGEVIIINHDDRRFTVVQSYKDIKNLLLTYNFVTEIKIAGNWDRMKEDEI